MRLRVFGRSMAPTLSSGTQIEVRPLIGRPRRGDVVACASRGRLVVHRVVRVEGSQVVTQGDASPAPDPPWPIGDLLGSVALPQRGAVRPLPLGRRLRRALQSLRLGAD